MKDVNLEQYTRQYKKEIDYKYKTNTRYQRYLIECLEKYMDEEKVNSVVDVGCGQGLNTVLFLDDFTNAVITGIDLSETGIQYAKSKWGGVDRISFQCGDITVMPFKNQYDLVTAFELLEHIKNWKQVAKALCQASNRYIMVSSPVGRMREYEIMHGHYRNFKRGELESFFNSNGFRTVKTYYAGFPFWSPITRDLLNLMPGDSRKAQENLSTLGKISSLILYYLFRYCSLKSKGDQFIGLFEKKEIQGE